MWTSGYLENLHDVALCFEHCRKEHAVQDDVTPVHSCVVSVEDADRNAGSHDDHQVGKPATPSAVAGALPAEQQHPQRHQAADNGISYE